MANKISWEVIEDTTPGQQHKYGLVTERSEVPGQGWLVRTTYSGYKKGGVSLVFVPNPDGNWLAK